MSATASGRDCSRAVTGESGRDIPDIPVQQVARYPHDAGAFTQGLVFLQGKLYESTGLEGHSDVRRVDPESGRVEQVVRLRDTLFGEGLASVDGKLIQLTWRSGTAMVYTVPELREVGRFGYTGEGWGGTGLNARLLVSDGSARLRFHDPATFLLTATLTVTAHGRPVTGLNELETVAGSIFANVYPTDCIARIDPRSGEVDGWLNLAGLLPWSERPDTTAVANGIAYDPAKGRLFVTGKRWPYLYELKLLPASINDNAAMTVHPQPGGRW